MIAAVAGRAQTTTTPPLVPGMESRPATMAKAARASPRRGISIPDEIAIWEILVRLPPKSLFRCRAVCRAWRRGTSTRDFILDHHARQPSLPIVSGRGELVSGSEYEDFLAFDHRDAADAQLQPVARLDGSFNVEASCDGLLVLSKRVTTATTRLSICNPATREHAPLMDLSFFSLLAMYLHRPTGEYRLLLHRWSEKGSVAGSPLPKGKIGCYIFALGSDQTPRYIKGLEAAAGYRCSMVRDSLHWFPLHHKRKNRTVLVFDTTTESSRQMRAPAVPTMSYIIEMDDTLGIYSYNDNDGVTVVKIWVLQNYEREVWAYKYKIKLPVEEIKGQFGGQNDHWYHSIVSVDGDILLLVSHGGKMFYVNTDGELVGSFHRDGQHTYAWDIRLKQTLVPHNFFTATEGCDVNASPFL